VDEGYGSMRISHYLYEHGIMGREGRNIPNVTIARMIKNKGYTGYLINGQVETRCPELQIIDADLFERAQQLREARTTQHSKIPFNSKSKALLVGCIYCAHCGNRLTLTTSGRKHKLPDGSIQREIRMRYQCHYNVRHPGECDGQSGYGVTKLDSIVDEVIRRKFAELKAASRSDVLSSQRKKAIAQAKAALKEADAACQAKQAEIADYRAKAIKVIRGLSKFSEELLTSLLEEAEADLAAAEAVREKTKADLKNYQESTLKLEQQYNQILTWADLYENSTFDAKKMIIQQLVKAIRVHRDYSLEIEFNVSFDEFQNCKENSQFELAGGETPNASTVSEDALVLGA
jgi:hypothetical protein